MSKDKIQKLIDSVQKKLDKRDMRGALEEKEKLDELISELAIDLAQKTWNFMHNECGNVNTMWPASIALVKYVIILMHRAPEFQAALKEQVEQLARELVNMVNTKEPMEIHEIKVENLTKH